MTPGSNFIGWSSNFGSVSAQQITMNSSGVVNQTTGAAHGVGNFQSGNGYNQWRGAGVLMSQPVVDDTPYRVKAYLGAEKSSMYIFVGYAPLAPTGTNDLITKVVAFQVIGYGVNDKGIFDEVFLLPGLKAGDPDFQKPLAFGVAVATEQGAGVNGSYNISVQNLAKTAPQFAASMS